MTTIPPRPEFDDELGRVYQEMAAFIGPAPTLANLPEQRSRIATLDASDDALRVDGTYAFDWVEAPGLEDDVRVPLLVIRPVSQPADAPAVYFVHGGGMILGSARSGVEAALALAVPYGGVVVSVDYRLAPEHPDPAPVEDSYAGLRWLFAHADELGVDRDRIIIAGGSAGGGIAAGTALLARDRGELQLAGQLLMCPMLDDRMETHSSQMLEGISVWDRRSNAMGWAALLGERRGTQDVSIYAAPSRAVDLANLPPAYIEIGSVDTFRDENVAYASAIWRSGGSAELHVWAGGFHGYDSLAPNAQITLTTLDARSSWVARILASTGL